MEMTAHTAADRTSNSESVSLDLSQLWMLPILLLSVMVSIFADYTDKLREKRRTRPMPKTWKEHWPNLRLAEWHIRQLTASGIEQIFSGKELDLHQLSMDPDPPEDFGQMPASAWEMHRRFEAIARFHADPEKHIRRAAQRILARDGEPDPLGRLDPRPPAAVVVIVKTISARPGLSRPHFAMRHASHPAQPIRAPPWLIRKQPVPASQLLGVLLRRTHPCAVFSASLTVAFT